MTRRLVVPTLALVGLLTATVAAGEPAAGWRQVQQPAAAGFDADGLDRARQFAEEIGSGAVMVVADGLVVAAWGDVERPFKCHSVRKSFLSALYGPAVADGSIDLAQTLAELGIDDRVPLTAAEKKATVEQLIQARSGVYHPAAKEPRSMSVNRPKRGSAKPGEVFWYNNWDFNTAGRIYERAVGQTIFEAFDQRLAKPLGMEDWRLDYGVHQFERNKTTIPAYAFRLSARDAARFGQLYLDGGRWGDRQVIPAAWIERSWTAYSEAYGESGYGYMWWVHPAGTLPRHPDTALYLARGTGGQVIAVLPSLDLVIVHRADTDFGRGVDGSKVWELIARILDARTGTPHADAATGELAPVPFARTLPELYWPATISLPTEVLDRYAGRYTIEGGPEVSLERLDDFLIGRMTGAGEADFFAVSETELWGKAIGAVLRFELDDEGAPQRILLTYQGQTLVARPWQPDSRDDSP